MIRDLTLQKERFQHRVLAKLPKHIAWIISVGVFVDSRDI